MTDTSSDPSKGKRLSEAEWTEAKSLYELGRATKTDLAKKYGISRQAMSKGLSDRGAVYGAKSAVVEQAAIDREKSDAVKRVEDIVSMKERQRKFVENLQALTIKQIMEKAASGQPISHAKSDIATLKNAMAIVVMGRSELYHLFDLHNDPNGDEELPEFIVSEYTPEEIEAINRQRMGLDDTDDMLDQLGKVISGVEEADGADVDDLLKGIDEEGS